MRFSLWMEQVSHAAGVVARPPGRLNVKCFLAFRCCWKRKHVPFLLGQHMTHEIIFMKTLHDQNDDPARLVIEPTIEGIIVPIIHSAARRV